MKNFKKIFGLCILFGYQLCFAADDGENFLGYWKTAQGDGIVQLRRCSSYNNGPLSALCGYIMWDIELNNTHRTLPLDCHRQVFEATKFEDGIWKNGWAFDTRKNKVYHTKLRLKDGYLYVRSFIGSEITGETEVFSRVNEVPKGCEKR